MTLLHSWRQDAISLTEALQALATQPLAGYCLSPAQFCFARWQDNTLRLSGELEIGQVYEARLFNAEIELRWLRDPAGNGTGAAACLAETAIDPAGWQANNPLEVEPLPDSHRLMTGTLGKAADHQTAWPLMDAPRHGKVAVPMEPSSASGRLAYRLREYLGPAPGQAGEDGNRTVIEERILAITTVANGSTSHGQ